MITIHFSEYSLHVSGHAGCGPYGQDIVCAGVSAIYNGVVLNLLALADDCTVTYDASPGNAWVSAEPVCGKANEVRAVFRFAAIALRKMAEQYSTYIQIL